MEKTDSRQSSHVKIVFELPDPEDGYPPVSREGIWGLRVASDRFRLDNIPFYAEGVSRGDLVTAEWVAGEWIFRKVVEPSGNSTFRMYVFDASEVPGVRKELLGLGCASEGSDIPNLISVEVPEEVAIAPFLDFIVSGKDAGRFDYEEGALRHPLPPS